LNTFAKLTPALNTLLLPAAFPCDIRYTVWFSGWKRWKRDQTSTPSFSMKTPVLGNPIKRNESSTLKRD
jgi:hypothetical protein